MLRWLTLLLGCQKITLEDLGSHIFIGLKQVFLQLACCRWMPLWLSQLSARLPRAQRWPRGKSQHMSVVSQNVANAFCRFISFGCCLCKVGIRRLQAPCRRPATSQTSANCECQARICIRYHKTGAVCKPDLHRLRKFLQDFGRRSCWQDFRPGLQEDNENDS